MSSRRLRKLGSLAALSSMVLIVAVLWPTRRASSTTSGDTWYARQVNAAWYDHLQLAGLTYDAQAQRFYAVVATDDGSLQMATLSGQLELLGSWRAAGAGLENPMPLYNPLDKRIYLLVSSPICCRLFSLAPYGRELRVEGRLASHSRPNAAAFDAQGRLWLMQADGAQSDGFALATFHLPPAPSGAQAIAADAHDHLTLRAHTSHGADLPAAQLAFVEGPQATLAGAGRAHSTGPVRQLGPLLDSGAGPLNAVLAPTLDGTDDPQALSLYAAGAHGLIEIAFQQAPTVEPLAVVTAPMVTMIDAWDWSPPSPDPAGITLLPSGQLLITDSEVEELDDIYEDANVFTTNASGALQSVADTTSFSDEPTGVTINPNNGHIFITDDDDRRVFQLDGLPGVGQLIGEFGTQAGSNRRDPEGIAYDPVSGHLFVVDGVDREVYIFDLDGEFVDNFDVNGFGISDPEGIAYDDINDRFLILDSVDGQIAEVKRDGELIRTIELEAQELDKPAGLVYGPPASSSLSRTLYVVDRQIDGNLNDGILFVFEVPAGPEPTPTFTPTPPPTSTSTATPTPPATSTNTATATHTPTATATASSTATSTPTASPTASATASPTAGTPTAANTPAGPTPTPETIPSDTPTPSPEPTATATPVGTVQPTATAFPGHRNYFPVLSFQHYDRFGEQNNSCMAAYPILAGTPYQFLPEDRDDWYKFTVNRQANITVHLTDFVPQLGQVAVYRGPACGSATFIASNGNNSLEKVVQLGDQPPGTFYIYVSNDGQLRSNALYSLIVQTR